MCLTEIEIEIEKEIDRICNVSTGGGRSTFLTPCLPTPRAGGAGGVTISTYPQTIT